MNPVPAYPLIHWHLYEPAVFTQRAFSWQLWRPLVFFLFGLESRIVHSLISGQRGKSVTLQNATDFNRILKAPQTRRHCYGNIVPQNGQFFGAQTTGKQCFLARLPKKHFTGNKSLRMLNLGNRAYATTESSQHCFLGVQRRKYLVRKQMFLKKNQKHFLFLGNKKSFHNKYTRKRGKILRNLFPQQCFLFCGVLRSFPCIALHILTAHDLLHH